MPQKIIDQNADFSGKMQTDYFLLMLVAGAMVIFFAVVSYILKSADNTETLRKMNKAK
jgi:hypothetical protein